MIHETHNGEREVYFKPTKATKYRFEVIDLMFENVKAYTEVNVNELSRILIRGDKTFVEKDG